MLCSTANQHPNGWVSDPQTRLKILMKVRKKMLLGCKQVMRNCSTGPPRWPEEPAYMIVKERDGRLSLERR